MNMSTTYIIIAVVVFFLFLLSIRIVKPNTVAVVLFLGKT